MIIECPHCQTRFRLDPAQLSDTRSLLKCARCRHVFPIPGQPPVRPRTPPTRSDQNLSFTFDDDDEWRAPELAPEDVPEDRFALNASAAEAPAVETPVPPAPPPRPLVAVPPRRPRPQRGELELFRDDD